MFGQPAERWFRTRPALAWKPRSGAGASEAAGVFPRDKPDYHVRIRAGARRKALDLVMWLGIGFSAGRVEWKTQDDERKAESGRGISKQVAAIVGRRVQRRRRVCNRRQPGRPLAWRLGNAGELRIAVSCKHGVRPVSLSALNAEAYFSNSFVIEAMWT